MKRVLWGLFYFIFAFGLAGGAWVFLKNTGTSLPAPDVRLNDWLDTYTIEQPLAIAVTRYRNVVYQEHFQTGEGTQQPATENMTDAPPIAQNSESTHGDTNPGSAEATAEQTDKNLTEVAAAETEIESLQGVAEQLETAGGTLFPLGQVAEGFTALAVMSMQEKGELSLDATLTELLEQVPNAWAEVTLRGLLTHQADAANGTRKTNGYSPEDYQWLTRVIERVSGQSAQEVIHERVLTPLEMNHTRFLTSPSEGWYATLADMLTWEDGLNSNRVVRMKTLLEGLQVEKVDGAWWPFNFGWQVENFGGLRMEQLLARGETSAASITRFPEKNFAVVVLSQSLPEGMSAAEIGWRIGEIYLDREMPRVLLKTSKQKKMNPQ